jgi:sugar lactone lactonase YvrE
MGEVACVQQANALLAEGPAWNSSEGVLYWVDMKRPDIFRWDPWHGQTGLWPMPRPSGMSGNAGHFPDNCRLILRAA